jgi:hypothetical protein
MKDLGNTIYSFGCVVAATVLGIGIADYWFGHHQDCILLLGGIGGHSLANRPRIFVRSGPSLKIRGRKLMNCDGHVRFGSKAHMTF